MIITRVSGTEMSVFNSITYTVVHFPFYVLIHSLRMA